MKLSGKIALVTGASSGIGKACAELFAEQGVNLILTARRGDRISKLAEQLSEKYSIHCYPLTLDVRDNESVKKGLSNLPENFGSIDILINNAGLARGLGPLHEGEIDDWNEMIDTNIKGLLHVTRTVVPGMVERGNGQIINIGSIAGRHTYPNGTVYCSTKYAVRAITQGLMIELVDTPIRVSTVDPGLVNTEFSLVRYHGDNDKASVAYDGMTPLAAVDVAEAVLFCATRPAHANISEMVILPTDQASPYHVHRRE